MLTNRPMPQPSDERADASPSLGDPAQLAELLVRTSRRLQRSAMAELGPMGLTGGQARVIRYLVAAGRPVRMTDIAAALEVVPRTATSVVDDLEKARIVDRAIDPHDRRAILVSLTGEGTQLIDRIAQARRRTAEATFNQLSPLERAEMGRMLTVLCGSCCGPKAKDVSRDHARSARRGPRPEPNSGGSN